MTLKAGWMDAAAETERVETLLAQMTVDEKLAQIAGVWVTSVIDLGTRQFDTEKARAKIPHGIGHLTRVGAASLLDPGRSAQLANSIQHYLVTETRLGIPAVLHEEACAGYMARGATSFPQAIAQAAMWQPELVEAMGRIINQQMRAVGARHALAPVLDVVRDPRWGRVEETYGEDPFLVSTVGTAYVRGIQGSDWRSRVVATAKHFLGYGWSEGGMNWAPAHIPERELREIFLTPFTAAIKTAGIASVMPAYHEMDGIPSHANVAYLVDLLRDELGFEGTAVSDYFGINMLKDYHKTAGDKADAAKQALAAGVDVELPAADCYGSPLREALDDGRIDIELVDACVRRVLLQKVQLGLFESPYVDEGRVPEIYTQLAGRSLSVEMARKSIVLLKNDGILPLSPTLSSVAVIGPAADSVRALQGDYHYPSHLENMFDPDANPDAPNPAQSPRDVNWSEHFPPSVTVTDGIGAHLKGGRVVYARGCDFIDPDTSDFEEAVKAARSADVAIVAVGDKSGLARGATSGESIDRASLDLPGVQQQLIEAIAATETPIVLVLLNGRPMSLTNVLPLVSAVVECWQPAEQGGTAIGDVLFGAVNPAGRLPMSFPRSVGQVPVYYNHKPSGGRSHWQGTYIDEETTPLFAFGHGLSYTSFNYSDLAITPPVTEAQGTVHIAVTVTNIGDRDGDEVVQLYIGDPVATVTRPVQALKGFTRLTLPAGESRRVTFALDVRHTAFYDAAMRYIVEPGEFTVGVGASSADIRLQGTFTVEGDVTEVEQVFSTPVIVE